jgi:TM2 domain-containing membrane protein YozV
VVGRAADLSNTNQPVEKTVSAPAKGVDEKYCLECAAVIKAKAVICPKCGCPQSQSNAVQALGGSGGQQRNKNTAGILALILGGLGAHKFYLGQSTPGLLYLAFCWTFIPAILGLIDAIKLFGMAPNEFDQLYN